ncbi:hypothetical protein C8J46_105437 [Sphingomonas sp. PP-F2F-A104-K0414]|uniref:hypothetical protein n=1 Tax=Sphingomonas sp. PP-F2F-A104-K0414 TaxID=2135661 RepID=UPI0010E72463|nr:hypothetical protein [Sphingomonas sp. PP-F2F-A104-K0414]TCP98281.1 hypothetical protein C8J46_105437 [Sphingomonas sp. PP-F2F-A104-K0414]
MPIKIVADDRVPQFLADALGVTFSQPFVTMGIEKGGRICAGALLNCFNGGNVNLTAAGTGWTRAFLNELGAYVFGALSCNRMTIVTAQVHVAELACRLGGKPEAVMRNHFGRGIDGIVVGILAHEYRYGSGALA